MGGPGGLLGILGDPLGASWSHLGAILGGLEGPLGGSGHLAATLGSSWAVMRGPWAAWGVLGAILNGLADYFAPLWGYLQMTK